MVNLHRPNSPFAKILFKHLKVPYPLERSTVGRFLSGDSVGDHILNMFNMDSRPTLQRVAGDFGELSDNYIPKGDLAVKSADSVVESANSTADSTADPPKIGVLVRALTDWVSLAK